MSGRRVGNGARAALLAVGAGAMVVVVVAASRTTASPTPRGPGHVQEAVQDPVFAVLPDRMPGGERDTPQLIELGRRLYFETALSSDGSMSCNTCHRIDADLAGTDYRPTSVGVRGNVGGRNAPTVLNAGYQMGQFWDARAKDLEEQAGGPPLNPIEMAMADSAALETALRAAPEYHEAFRGAFPDDPEPVTFVNATRAIAAFERTLRTPARLDAYLEGDSGALVEGEVAGMHTLVEVGCTTCHRGALLGGDRLMKMGLVHPYAWSADEGAGAGLFKVAQLRNVTLTPPYFHNGHASTIAEAVDRMAWLQVAPDGAGYTNQSGIVMVPSLWGGRSYNDGAGMARLLAAASFIRANMPLGTPWNRPALNEGEAYDVAAFMNSQERPVKTGKEVDYPNLLEKPVDAPYPPYPDEFSLDQHRFGPFGPIEATRRALRENTERVANPYVPAGGG